MVNFRSGPSAERQAISRHLREIQLNISNLAQFALFQELAFKLFDKNDRITKRGTRFQRILKAVEEVHTEIVAISLPEGIKDPDVIMKHYKDVCKILQEGAAKLNATRSPHHIKQYEIKEEEAVKSDQEGVEDAISQLQAPPVHSTVANIQVYRIETPFENAIPIPKFNCYKEIVWYLRDKNVVSKPELWRRLDAQQGASRKGYKWEFTGGDQLIDSPVVHVVNMMDRLSENYIIALSHDQLSDVEVPVPLDVIHVWDTEDEAKWCCRPFCGNLRRHLKYHWPDRLIIKATRLEEPFTSVITSSFDTSEFPPRTNNLYLQWEPKPQP